MTAKTQPDDSLVKQPMDRLLFLLTLVLLGVGIVTVMSASYAPAIEHAHGDPYYYVKRQAKSAAIGLLALWVTLRIPYWRWRTWAVPGVALAIVLLVATLVPHLGTSIGGARRWLGHGSLELQPSELAKLALVIYLAHVSVARPKYMRSFRQGLLPPLLVIGMLAVLIAMEPDLGTAMVLGGTGLMLLYIAGARPRHMVSVLALVAVAVGLYAVSKPYRLHRLTAFLNPKADQYHSGYQVWHALIALGSGGIAGFGLGEGVEKLYLPMASTDFIFPVIAEEWGLIGTLALVTIFALLAARGFTIAYRTRDPFGALLAAGITAMVSLQALVNMAVATSSVPNTGVPLPFISYGGSSLVLMLAGIGLLLNISCFPHRRGVPDEQTPGEAEPSEQDWNRRWDRRLAAGGAEEVPLRRMDRGRRTGLMGE